MIDTRTFVELNKILTEQQKDELREVVVAKSSVSDAAYRAWRLGRRRPSTIYQKIIVRELKKLGYTTSTKTLFPKQYSI